MIMLIIAFLAVSCTLFAKESFSPFANKKVETATAIVSYAKDYQGFWKEQSPKEIILPSDMGKVGLIGKNNKERAVYVRTGNALIEVVLDKKSYSDFKSDKAISNLKEKEWEELFRSESQKLSYKFRELNDKRSQEIGDSIAEARRLEELRAQEAARREAARRDSILSADADRKYRETSNYSFLDISNLKNNLSYSEENSILKCVVDGCNERISGSEIHTIKVKSDTLIYATITSLPLGITEPVFHALPLTDRIKKDEVIDRHLRVWKDSLAVEPGSMWEAGSIQNNIRDLNYLSLEDATKWIKKIAPNGYVDSWSWDNEYGPVSLNITYCNTNKKPIKYIKFFFSIYNDVGDVRGSGSVQGTGPVEEFSSGTWDFDYTRVWVAGDATRMKITKIIITYMNGATATLTGNKIIYDYD